MVAAPSSPLDGDEGREEYYDELQERWPEERASRKRPKKRAYRRKEGRRVVVRGQRLNQPDTARMSRALLAAQRELAQAEAEKKARTEGDES